MIYLKKIGYIFCILLAITFSTKNTSIATTTGTVYLSSDKQAIEIDEEIEITLNIKDINTAVFTSYLHFDNTKLEYISGPDNTNAIDNRVIFVWYDETGGSNAKQGELAKFKFKALQNGIATFTTSGEYYTETGQQIDINFEEIQVQIGKEETKLQKEAKEEQGTDTTTTNSNLNALRIDVEGIVPTFSKDIYEYDLTIGNEINDIEVLAVSENPNATVEITGNHNLKQGLNDIIIKVISEDKTSESMYKISVTKTENAELANTNLETLAIENVLLNPPFYTNITNYEIEISNDTTSLNILAVPENEQGTIQIIGYENLQEGNNLISVIVTAPNGITTREYTINAYKRNQEEEQAYLEEQKGRLEKLEEAYDIEMNSETNEEGTNSENNENTNNNKIIYIVLGVIGIIIIIGSVYYVYKRNKNIEK